LVPWTVGAVLKTLEKLLALLITAKPVEQFGSERVTLPGEVLQIEHIVFPDHYPEMIPPGQAMQNRD
jgi:hypothetical protein